MNDHSMPRWLSLAAIVCLIVTSIHAQQVTPLGDLLTFPKEATESFKLTFGTGVRVTSQCGVAYGDDKDLLQLSFQIQEDAAKNARWFTLALLKPLDAGQCKQAQGIGIELMADPGGSWWINAIIRTTDGKSYSHVMIPQQVESTMRQRLIAFDQFKNKEGQTLPVEQIQSLSINASVYPDRVLFIKRFFLYSTPQRTLDFPVEFHTNAWADNLFEPGQEVDLQFKCQLGLPPGAMGLFCQLRDFEDQVVLEHTFDTADLQGKTFSVKHMPRNPGFYDVQAWWVDAKASRLEALSCLRTTGSMPDGHGSLAVMPKTVEHNRQRMTRVGNDGFLGLHGHHTNLAEMMGVSWRLDSPRWKWLEPNGPSDRTSGMAPWARKIIAEKPQRPPYLNAIVNLGINLNRPKWAVSATPDVAPGINAWDQYMTFFKDYLQVSKHLSASMKRRPIDLAWEINLNEPGSGIHKPVYHPEDVVEIYRRARPIIDAVDPDAILMGPCTSGLAQYNWNLPLFEKGLLPLLDAYNCHGYHAPPPEEARIPEHFAKLHKAIRQYNNGKDLDVYITELGYRSMYGSEDRQKDHARWHARVAGILKGEGIRAYLPFYSYDYTQKIDGSWGICYNLDPNLKFGPEQVSPKAAVPALAVFADQTEGLFPVTRLAPMSDDLWGYVFASRAGDDVLAMLWSVHRDHQLVLPAGNVKQVTVTDMMGRSYSLPVVEGLVTLVVTPSPVYVRGLSPELYPQDQSISRTLLAELYPGDQKTVTLPKEMKNALIQGVFGGVQAGTDGNVMTLDVKPDCPSGLVALQLDVPGQKRSVRWLAIRQPLELADAQLIIDRGKLVQRVILGNHAQQPLTTELQLTLDNRVQTRQTVTLAGNTQQQMDLPLELDTAASPTRTWRAQLKLTSPTLEPIEHSQSFNLLAAHEIGSSSQDKFNNTATWSGKGASGKTDQASASFTWNAQGLTVDLTLLDDQFYQQKTDGLVWQQDSIQFAFDTDPDLKEVYEPLAGIFTKKLCRLAFARTPNGLIAWRHTTHNEEQLPLGEITREFQMNITRQPQAGTTRYQLVIPWQQIGLDHVQAGKSIGMSILVNDSDGPQTQRAMYELFSSLTTRLPQDNGRLLLQ